MCVYSMIADHYLDKWKQLPPVRYDPLYPQPYSPVVVPVVVPRPAVPAISQEELDEFRKLLRRARAYDRKNNEPAPLTVSPDYAVPVYVYPGWKVKRLYFFP